MRVWQSSSLWRVSIDILRLLTYESKLNVLQNRAPTETGMARLSLDDDDKRVRHWLIEQVQAIGCKVTVDQMGNIFAVRPGKNANVAPVMMGSHLDTQPTGGRYDGILGVLSALEALRTIHESGYETEGPVGLVNWTKLVARAYIQTEFYPNLSAIVKKVLAFL